MAGRQVDEQMGQTPLGAAPDAQRDIGYIPFQESRQIPPQVVHGPATEHVPQPCFRLEVPKIVRQHVRDHHLWLLNPWKILKWKADVQGTKNNLESQSCLICDQANLIDNYDELLTQNELKTIRW